MPVIYGLHTLGHKYTESVPFRYRGLDIRDRLWRNMMAKAGVPAPPFPILCWGNKHGFPVPSKTEKARAPTSSVQTAEPWHTSLPRRLILATASSASLSTAGRFQSWKRSKPSRYRCKMPFVPALPISKGMPSRLRLPPCLQQCS